MSRNKYLNLRITRAQADYLIELIEDDVNVTDLTPDERSIANAVLSKTIAVQEKFAGYDEEAVA